MTASTLLSAVAPADEERLRHIGAFICRLAQQLPEPSPKEAPARVLPEDDAPDARILAYLGRGREASPVEIRLSLGLSRTMTYRALQRLALEGQVVSHGSTKAVVYRAVAIDPARN
jgi:uncharacterized membrane protein